jgi:uncharacterized membrane protein YdbT with pleckstrin-like domain
MSYIEKNLLPDEQIIFRTKKHFIIFFIPFLLTLITLLMYIYIPHLLTTILGPNMLSQGFLPTLVLMFCGLPAIAALFSWLKEWLNYSTSDFVVTNKRLIMKEGFFVRRSTDTRLTTISHVSVNQSLLGQILNFGAVGINNFGGTRDAFMQISAPNTFQQQVNSQLDKLVK